MGFMTDISILNDRWDEIRKNPAEFVEQIFQSNWGGSDLYGHYVIGQTTVAKTHHADDIRVYFSGRNSFFDAYPEKGLSKESLERHLGYLKEMRSYLKVAQASTQAAIDRENRNEHQKTAHPEIQKY